MTVIRVCVVSVAVFLLALNLVGCSKTDNGPKPTGVQLFGGCPVSSQLDDYTGNGSAVPKALFSNGYGLWAVGSAKGQTGTTQGLVRFSKEGTNWSDVDLSGGPANQGAVNNSIATDASNKNIYVAQTYTNGSHTSANIRYSTDGGQTWQNAPFQLQNQNNETLTGVVLSPSGNPYFVGNSGKTGFVLTFDQGKAVLVHSAESSEYRQIAVNAAASLFVVGARLDDKGARTWLFESGAEPEKGKNWDVRKAEPNEPKDTFPIGLDASTLKLFGKLFRESAPRAAGEKGPPLVSDPDLSTLSGSANSVLATSDGVIYEAGTVSTKLNTSNDRTAWVVRVSIDGGKTFTLSDIFHDRQFQSSIPVSLSDFDGHAVAVGVSRDSNSSSHWHVRMAPSRLSGWATLISTKTSDDANEESARPVGSAGIGYGDGRGLIIVGDSRDKATGNHHWVTKKISSCVKPH